MTETKKSIFVVNGQSLAFTFILVSSLFLLWGLCNGMIDVMDKHFQDELGLTKSQSAWVQFAHYLGYFLMAMPAGWLASKLGYKGGIIAGLLIVAAGGFWFIQAAHIAQFWAYLLGVCVIAAGLTFLETVANPYTTVLGDPKYAATRINLAQSCNGVGWIFGPIIGGLFFYSKNAAGVSTGSQTLYIPYAAIAVTVVVLAVVFYFAEVPDIKAVDDYRLDENGDAAAEAPVPERQFSRGLVYLLLWLNAAVLVFACGMILWVILNSLKASLKLTDQQVNSFLEIGGAVALLAAAALLAPVAKKISHRSIWSHPHFTGATLAQFFYVAAQAGIFSFFINYMTTETPAIPASWASGWLSGWLETGKDGILHLSDQGAANLAAVGFACFLTGRFTGAGLLRKFSAHKMLGLYALLNVVMTLVVVLKLGWISVICVFASYFFMSIMFPTIFALGIFGLGTRAKKASSFIVMAIMGGAILPKLMGAVGERNMSRGFIVPMACFALVAFYGFNWSRFSKADSLQGGGPLVGH
jgi:FHS family L-fucose permease-like MFS transporter